LYHMTEPLELLSHLCRTSARLFIWTHYFDADRRGGKSEAEFSKLQSFGFEGKTYSGASRLYKASSLRKRSYSGGASNHAIWLTRDSILRFLDGHGFECSVQFDEPEHPNGPSFAILAVHPRLFETGLPADFDPVGYLRLNEDVVKAGADPRLHYLEFGKVEGRRYR
jgi:hypothetical protein